MAADDRTKLDEGTIDLVDNQVDQATGTIKLKASFPNAALRLWPGDFVNGRIVVEERKNGVTVPAAALRHGPRGDFVWIVSQEQKAELRIVTAGQSIDGRVLIERGMKPGEQVVTDGHFRLEAGVPVEIIHR
jgi:multidrug efflux system membrane fusion protein